MIAVSALALAASAASAADLAARPYTKAPLASPVYDWSGWYVGINGGGGWAHDCFTAPDLVTADGCHSASGGVVGGQFGWRTQTGWLVWGLDFQGDWADIKGSSIGTATAFVNTSKTTNFGIFSATAGYAVNNVLLYAKGGGAWTGNTFGSPTIPDTITETRWGAALGAGLEYGLTQNWTIGVEWDHLFMGAVNETLSTGRPDRIGQNDVDIVTARVNYKFGGPVVARY